MTLASKHVRITGRSLSAVYRSLSVSLALSLYAQNVSAGDSGAETRAVARDLAAQGVEAYEQHDYATALDRLGRAYALVPAPSISIVQARALAQVGRVLEALDVYEKTQRVQLTSDAPEAFKQAVSDARREGEALLTQVPRLKIHVGPSSVSPKSLTLLLDSKLVPQALFDVDRPIDPGPHEVRVRAEDFEPETRMITLSPGDHVTLDIPLTARPSTNPSSAIASGTSSAPSDKRYNQQLDASLKPWAWAAVGTGTAALVLSAVTGVVALEKKSALDSQCHPGCPVSAADDLSTFRTTRTLSYVSLFAGVATIGLGGYVLVAGNGEQKVIGTSLGPTGVHIWGSF